jgi:hypothetical protein
MRRMSWVTDLALGLGVPAGAAAVAVAMYAACFAAEQVARPEALHDIGRILKDPSWSRTVQPSLIIERIFIWTFGEQQLSLKCAFRSAIATMATFIWLMATFSSEARNTANYFASWIQSVGVMHVLTQVFLTTFLPDYLALAKTRCLLRIFHERQTYSILISMFDLGASIGISILTYFLISLAWDKCTAPPSHAACILEVIGGVVTDFPGNSDFFSYYDIAVISTVLTSVWTILVLLSTTLLKLLSPVQCFTSWFFDVDDHPVKAVGIISGALVMIGSLIWTVLRAVI